MTDHMTITPRRCALKKCGRTLRRKAGESGRQCAHRRYCDQTCYHAARRERESGPARRCRLRECRKVLVRREDEPMYSFRVRKFCGRACLNGAARERARRNRAGRNPVMRDGRRCSHCGAELVRHARWDADGNLVPTESSDGFKRRVFCGRACQYAARKGRKIGHSTGNWPKKRTPIVRDEAPDWRPNVVITEIPAERLRGPADAQAGRSLLPWVGW